MQHNEAEMAQQQLLGHLGLWGKCTWAPPEGAHS